MKMRILAAALAFTCMTGIAFHQAMAQGIPPMPSEKQLLSCIAGSGYYNEKKCDKAKNDLEKHMDAVSDACKEADTFEGKKIWLKDLFSLYVHYNPYLEDERALSWEEMCGAFLWEQNTWVEAYTDDIVPLRLQTLELNLEVDDEVEVHARIYTSVCKEPSWDTCGEEKELPYSGEWAWGSTNPDVFVVEKEYSRTGLVKAVGGGTATLVVLMPDFEEDPHLLQAGPDVIVDEQCDLTWTFGYTEVSGWPDHFNGRYNERSAARTLEIGWTLQFEVKAEDYLVNPPRNPIPQCLSDEWIWTSEDESIATVDQTGLVTAVGLGRVSLIAKHAQHPEIWAEAIVNVVESWLDKDGDRISDWEYFGVSYHCSVGPTFPYSIECPLPDPYREGPECPTVYVPPGQEFWCKILVNHYTDPNLDCNVPDRHGADDPKCENYTIVERRELWIGSNDPVPNYFDWPIVYRNEEAMQYWWLDW